VGFRVQDVGFKVQGAGFSVQGAGFSVHGLGLRVQGAGLSMNCRWRPCIARETVSPPHPPPTPPTVPHPQSNQFSVKMPPYSTEPGRVCTGTILDFRTTASLY